MIIVESASFITSAQSIRQAPPPILSEIVFLGRSNVGKSTLINKILESNLAKSSSTPGKTRLINFFKTSWRKEDNRLEFMLIDLPGIGYANVSKTQKKLWQQHLWEFINKRSSIKLFIHLVDARHTNLNIDKILQENLKKILKPDQSILKVLTKADKLTKNDLTSLLQKKAFLIGNNDTIFNEKFKANSGKIALRELIFYHILGLHTKSSQQNQSNKHIKQAT